MSSALGAAVVVAVLLLVAVAAGCSVVAVHLARQARNEATASRDAARRVASWCGIPEWWVPSDRWPTERPPRDRATAEARWNAAHGVTPPQGDPTFTTLRRVVDAETDALTAPAWEPTDHPLDSPMRAEREAGRWFT